jgi:ribosomal protein S18 acetylase RimI-like enzyme
MKFTTRPAKLEDCDALATFAARTFSKNFGHLYDPKDLERHLQKTCSADFFRESLKNDRLFISLDQDRIIGYVKAGKLSIPFGQAGEGAFEIHRLYVDEQYQRQRVGNTLMQSVLRLPEMQEADEIYLGVWENNYRAQAFYARHGFEVVGEYPYYVGTHIDRELIMRRARQAKKNPPALRTEDFTFVRRR